MATKKSEKPRVLLRKVSGGFEFVDTFAMEQCENIGIGATVEVQIWQPRSAAHSRLYWAVLGQCVSNSDDKYGSAEDLHEVLKFSLGYQRTINLLAPSPHSKIAAAVLALLRDLRRFVNVLMTGRPDTSAAKGRLKILLERIDVTGKLCRKLETETTKLHLPGSIAFDKMDQSQFNEYFKKAMLALESAGYPADSYIEEGKKKVRINSSD